MSDTEDDFPLTTMQVQALCHLAVNTYQKQAHACYDADAPLACCIMASGAVEAILTALTGLNYVDAVKAKKAPKKKLLKWTLHDLLAVAMELKWLPEELTPADKLDFRQVKTPARTDTIRESRNLVHPARYLKDRNGKEYTLEELRTLYATCHAAYDCLINVVSRALEQKEDAPRGRR